MAIRNIVKEGDPILNKVCRPVTNFDDRLATLLDDMRETMIAADGVVWQALRWACCAACSWCGTPPMPPRRSPRIMSTSSSISSTPRSWLFLRMRRPPTRLPVLPRHNGAVTRPVAVKVRAQDRNGNWFELEAEDLLARCIQHENDHLDGITIMESSEYFYEDTEEGKKGCP